MIEYIKKDLTTITHGVIGQGVNCQGKMGKGVAKDIRNKWPIVYSQYLLMCSSHSPEELLGTAHLINVGDTQSTGINQLFVANCFTQEFYGRDGKRYADPLAIKKALTNTLEFCKGIDLPLYMPKIGCGLGGLNWEKDVLSIIEELDAQFQLPIFICGV